MGFLITQDLLATNLGNGDIDGAGVIELAGISSSSSGASGACRLSFSSVLLIAVTVLIIKVKKTSFHNTKIHSLLILSTINSLYLHITYHSVFLVFPTQTKKSMDFFTFILQLYIRQIRIS